MKTDFDNRIIRIFSYVLFGTVILTAMKMVLWLLQGGPGAPGVSIFQGSNTFMLIFFFLEDLAVIGLFYCLYRMAGIKKWFDVAGTMLLCLLFSEVIARIVEWVIDYMDDKTLGLIILYTVEVLPQVFLLLGVLFMINGIIQLQKDMKVSSDRLLRIRKLRLYWILGGTAGFLASLIQRLFSVLDLGDTFRLYTKLGTGIMLAFYILICIQLSLQTRSFCQEYYMFRYNRGIGGGSDD